MLFKNTVAFSLLQVVEIETDGLLLVLDGCSF